MIVGAPINVDDYIPAGINTAITDCTAFIQAAIDDAAASNGRSVVFSTKTYRINSTVEIKANSTTIDGRGCTLDYYGSSVAVDFVPINGITYPVSCRLSNIEVRVRIAASGTGFRIRASYSSFENLGVVLYVAATSARGIMLVGDEVNGTGPYYNQFFNCGVQSQSLSLDHIGISFVAVAPSYRSPNANTFYGGRVGQCAQNIVIKGAGNSFFNQTVENASGTGTSFKFEADSPTNCVQNSIFGAYLENANIGVLFSADASANSVYSLFATGIGTLISDLGTNNLIVDTSVPTKLPTGINPNGVASSNANVLDAYIEGTWTPTLEGATTPGSYTLSNVFANYIKIGRLVTVNASMSITEDSAGTGSLKFGGLPFPKAADQVFTGEVIATNFVYPAGVANLSAVPTTNGLTSFFGIVGNKSGTAGVDIECADISASSTIAVSFSYLSPT